MGFDSARSAIGGFPPFFTPYQHQLRDALGRLGSLVPPAPRINDKELWPPHRFEPSFMPLRTGLLQHAPTEFAERNLRSLSAAAKLRHAKIEETVDGFHGIAAFGIKLPGALCGFADQYRLPPPGRHLPGSAFLRRQDADD